MFKLLVPLIFILAAYLTVYRSAAVAFATIYLPALLLVASTPKISVPGLPDMNATYGAVYGILAGLALKGGEPFPFKWGWIDRIVLLMTVSCIITASITDEFWAGVNVFGEQLLGYVAPYFLARIMFHDAEMRKRALYICIFCAVITAFFALIELRLWPYFMSRNLKGIGLFSGQNTMVLGRFGLFRTQGPYCHPIDMGNASLLLAMLIGLFATTTSIGLRSWWVRLGLFAAVGSALSSLSFTSFMGIAACGAGVAVIWFLPKLGKLMPIAVVGMFIVGGMMTNRLLNMDVERESEDVGKTVQDSVAVRAMIVQNSWEFVTTSGWFGYGNTIRRSQLNLDSVDNSYILFTMRRGFAFLALFLSIPVILAWRARKAFKQIWLPQHYQPLALGIAGVLGIMVSMYTVWFGFVYSVMWMIVLAMTTSMLDVIQYGAPAKSRATQPQDVQYATGLIQPVAG